VGNGMDSWRGRRGRDEGGDVAASCSTSAPRPCGHTNATTVRPRCCLQRHLYARSVVRSRPFLSSSQIREVN
jgi:hypothetical protein